MNMQNFDNYILEIAALLTAVAAGLGQTTIALIIMAVGMILKAIGSSIDPNYKIFSVANSDNLILAFAGVFAALAAYFQPTSYWAIGLIVSGMILKAVGSAIDRSETWKGSLDNIALGVLAGIGASLTFLGYPQYSFMVVAASAFVKGMVGNYLRNQVAVV
jgi:hypothetical protein